MALVLKLMKSFSKWCLNLLERSFLGLGGLLSSEDREEESIILQSCLAKGG